jgi:uncharacterized protein (TIGR03905 family)
MVREYKYTPKGVCSRFLSFKYDDESLKLIEFNAIGGCSGNLQGIKALIEGLHLKDIAKKLEGVKCGFKNTSCPDQISRAIKALLEY